MTVTLGSSLPRQEGWRHRCCAAPWLWFCFCHAQRRGQPRLFMNGLGLMLLWHGRRGRPILGSGNRGKTLLAPSKEGHREPRTAINDANKKAKMSYLLSVRCGVLGGVCSCMRASSMPFGAKDGSCCASVSESLASGRVMMALTEFSACFATVCTTGCADGSSLIVFLLFCSVAAIVLTGDSLMEDVSIGKD